MFLLLACVTPEPTPAEVTTEVAPEEARRRDRVGAELAAGRPTELRFDTTRLHPPEQEMVTHLLDAAQGIEELNLRQRGAWDLEDQVADADSRALFFRNSGPWCEAPATRDDPDCSALPSRPPRTSGLYPAAVQQPGFCETLQAERPELFEPFTAMIDDGGTLRAVPYSRRWPEPMARVATALESAARSLEDAPDEQALRTYLSAAAQAFRDDGWTAADLRWAEMNGENSSWYVRIGPDETYGDPCGRHAFFHLTLARVSRDGRAWQDRLDPIKQAMEQQFAGLAGPRYTARPVGFELPEFIEIVLNAGDDRMPLGSTTGQSLPNWGPVADAGARTVAMTNVGTDEQSIQAEGAVLDSLFCPATRALWPSDPEARLASTVLHEAAHNLGPIGNHQVDGKTDAETFGGQAASMLEELKAQTAALYFPPWLAGRGLLPEDRVVPMAVGDVAWALSQVADGFTASDGTPQAYPRLAAIQLGWLADHGAVRWEPTTLAANGADTGCFAVDAAALGPAVDALAAEVLRIEGEMDVGGLTSLVARYVDDDPTGAWPVVAERFARQPKATYVYVLDGRPFAWEW